MKPKLAIACIFTLIISSAFLLPACSTTTQGSTESQNVDSSLSGQSESAEKTASELAAEKQRAKEAKAEEKARKKAEKEAKKAAEKAKKEHELPVGAKRATDSYELEVLSARWQDAIYPPDTSGYYWYWEDKPGKSYYVVTIDFKSLMPAQFRLDNRMSFLDMTFNNKYKGTCDILYASDPEHLSARPIIEPLETNTIYLMCEASDEIRDNFDQVEVEWKFKEVLGGDGELITYTPNYVADFDTIYK